MLITKTIFKEKKSSCFYSTMNECAVVQWNRLKNFSISYNQNRALVLRFDLNVLLHISIIMTTTVCLFVFTSFSFRSDLLLFDLQKMNVLEKLTYVNTLFFILFSKNTNKQKEKKFSISNTFIQQKNHTFVQLINQKPVQ